MTLRRHEQAQGAQARGGQARGGQARGEAGGEVQPWSRHRLQMTLAVLGVVTVVLVAGLGVTGTLMVRSALEPDTAISHGQSGAGAAGAASASSVRDEIAAEVMLQVDPGDAQPGPPAAAPGPSIAVPPSTRTGPAGVPSGFDRSPEGAVGQLAAIDTEVLQAMSIRRVNEVHQGWSMPGAPPVREWEMTRNVQAFLGAAGMTDELAPAAIVTAVPAAGQVKGSDGSDWVVACVLLQVRATVTTTSQLGYGRCERMQWTDTDTDTSTGAGTDTDAGADVGPGGRWMIAPGPAPASAPSTWPGTDRAMKAGWRSWAWAETASLAGTVAEVGAGAGAGAGAGEG